MTSRRVLWGCGIVMVLGLGIVMTWMMVSTLFPNLGQPSAGSASSILVNINLPLNGSELALNEPVSVYAEAVSGSTVHELELWVDGVFNPAKTGESPADQSPLNAIWLWTPTEEGPHRLIVRAIGPGDEVVESNVVRVSVLPRDKIADLQVATIPADQLPPFVTPDASLLSKVPTKNTVTPEPPPMPAEPPPPGPQVPLQAPGAPVLQGIVNQCDAVLAIQDNTTDEKGFYLYRFDPTSTDFTRVATLDKHAGTGSFNYLDPGLGLGSHTYYIASFDGNGERASNLINLKITAAQCAGVGPQAFGLQDALLTTSQGVDKVYCYLSVDQGPWSRIPPGTNEFIYPSAGGFDLGKYLDTLISPPPLGGVTLELECWGWSGNTLVYLGDLKRHVGVGPIQLVAQDFSLFGKGLDIPVPETHPYDISSSISPPRYLKFINDVAECIAQYGNTIPKPTAVTVCNWLNQGYSILSWKWIPGCWFPKAGDLCPYAVQDIGGFHIYRDTPGNDPVLAMSITNPKIRIATIPPTSSAHTLIPPRYFVRAYAAGDESADSEHIQGPVAKYDVTLTHPWLRVTTTYRYHDGDAGQDTSDDFPENDVQVGYAYFTTKDVGSQWWNSSVYDAQVHFNLSDIKGSIKGSVTRAILRWKWKASEADHHGVPLLSKGCLISLTDRNGAVIANYPLAEEYDVTTQVRSWVNRTAGIDKSGFVLVSGERSLQFTDVTEACLETYGDFQLEVSSTQP